MSEIKIHREHHLGHAAARKIAYQWAEQVETDFGMDCTYEEGASALPSFVPEMYNFGASYSFWRLQVRVSYNYTGAFLFSYNANPLNQAYQSDGDSIDVNLQCKITPWLNASVNVQNLGNKWPGQYVGEPNRVTIAEVFGRRITVGIRGRF